MPDRRAPRDDDRSGPGGDRPGGRFPRKGGPGGGFRSGPGGRPSGPGGFRPGPGGPGPRPGQGGGFRGGPGGPRPGGRPSGGGPGPRPGGFQGGPGGHGPRPGGDRPGGYEQRPGGDRPGGFGFRDERGERPARPWERDDRGDRGPRPWERDDRGDRGDRGPRPWERDERPSRPWEGGGRPAGPPRGGPRPWDREPGFERRGPRPDHGAPGPDRYGERRGPGPDRGGFGGRPGAPYPRPGAGRPARPGGPGGPRREWPRPEDDRPAAPRFAPDEGPAAGFEPVDDAIEAPGHGFEPAPHGSDAAPGDVDAQAPHDTPAAFDEEAAEARFEGGPGAPAPRPAPWAGDRPMRPAPGPREPWADRRGGPGPGRRPWPERGPARTSARWQPPRPTGLQDPTLALGDDEELVAGRRPVEEAFVARREAKRLLVVPQRRMALEKLVLHATSLRIPVVEVEGGSLTAISGFDGHQGIALVVAPRRWASPDDVLARAAERGEPPLVLVLDSLEDPQNVGTLLRTAEATGAHGAVFPTRHQAPLSPAAVKASAGAVEHLRLAPVDDLAGALADLHVRGLRIVGADGDAPLTAREADLRGPIAIVVGSEGRGLGPAVRRRCDLLVRIPMHGHVESLNAAVAGSILLYEAAAQRRTPEAPLRPHADDAVDTEDAGPHATAAAAPGDRGSEAAPPAGELATEPAATPDAAPTEPAATPDGPAPAEPPADVDAATDPAEAPAPPAPRARKPRAPRASAAKAAPATPVADDDLLPGGPALDAAPEAPGEASADTPADPAADTPEV